MTTELSKLQIENPPKKDKNEGGELVHGEGLPNVAGPEEVKGASHATAQAMMVKDKRKKAWDSHRTEVQADQVRKRVGRRERGKAEAHKLFATEDDAAQGQTGSPWSLEVTITLSLERWRNIN